MRHTTKWKDLFLIGKVDEENIYLRAPLWNCGWYWGFGYLGNKDCHYHLDGLVEKHHVNMSNSLKKEFGDSLTITEDSDLWIFCELVKTSYTLRKTAEVLGRGGSNYTENPCKDIIINKIEAGRLNEKVLPTIFDSIDKLLSKYRGK